MIRTIDVDDLLTCQQDHPRNGGKRTNPVFRAVHFERLCRRLRRLGCTTPSARQSRLTDDRIEMYSEIPVVGEPPRFSERPGDFGLTAFTRVNRVSCVRSLICRL